MVNKRKRVMIVDDHPIMRRGLRRLIEAEPDLEVAAEAADMVEAIDRFQYTRPDLVMLDVTLPGGNGIELIEKFRAMDSTTRILIVSMHDDIIYAERAFHAKADGYINKSNPACEIIAAVRSVLAGQLAISKETNDRLLRRTLHMDPPETSPVEALTESEIEVLDLIGRGLSVRGVASELNLSENAIESYQDQIRKKLLLQPGDELARFATRWRRQALGHGDG